MKKPGKKGGAPAIRVSEWLNGREGSAHTEIISSASDHVLNAVSDRLRAAGVWSSYAIARELVSDVIEGHPFVLKLTASSISIDVDRTHEHDWEQVTAWRYSGKTERYWQCRTCYARHEE